MVLFDFPGAWCLYISRMHTISYHFMVLFDFPAAYHFMVFIDFLKEYHFSERQFAIKAPMPPLDNATLRKGCLLQQHIYPYH